MKGILGFRIEQAIYGVLDTPFKSILTMLLLIALWYLFTIPYKSERFEIFEVLSNLSSNMLLCPNAVKRLAK